MSEDYDPQQSDVVMADQIVLDEFRAEDDAAAYGVDLQALTPDRLRHWHRQQAFLVAYAASGNLSQAARDTNIHIRTVEAWRKRDVWAFMDRCENALSEHGARLYKLTMNRLDNPEKGLGSDSLLIAANNAHPKLPEWSYRGKEETKSESRGLGEILSLAKGKRRVRVTEVEVEEQAESVTEGVTSKVIEQGG